MVWRFKTQDYFKGISNCNQIIGSIGDIIRLFLCLLFLCVSTSCRQSELVTSAIHDLRYSTFSAHVTRIIDGDTMEVLYEGRAVRIRLAHIDCPENISSQPFGKLAKQALSHLCNDKSVMVISAGYDRYGRLLAEVKNDKGLVVNEEMVRKGMAWHFKRYSKNTTYAHLEYEARQLRVGLWAEKNPSAPWMVRK